MSLADLHERLTPILAPALAELPGTAPGYVLDIGCGEGLKLPLLQAAWPSCRIVGIDRDRGVLEQAASTGYYALAAGDAQALPLGADCFDMVWCCATLGLLDNPLAALHELGRTLRPGGRVIVITATQRWVQLTCWPAELRALLEKTLRPWYDQLGDPDSAGLATLLLNAGLEQRCVRCWPLDGDATPGDELGIAEWARLRPIVAPVLEIEALRRCEEYSAAAEIVMVSLAVAALAVATA